MARTWIIDGRGIASKVKNANSPAACQIKDCRAKRECPYCHNHIDNSDVVEEWPGLPVGVKFDPSDVELLGHLAAKSRVGNSEPHMFIDEFIPTIEGDEGICYTHPENLPGAKKDGSSIHFFYRTLNAYAKGHRKRRKIYYETGLIKEAVRWHKTGKTKPLMENGIQKGYKKIMVLYSSARNGGKADKSSWVMHQYHLGADEDEKEGEYVVCKIFFQQPKQSDNGYTSVLEEESDIGSSRSPRTPKTITPQPPRPGDTPSCDDIALDHAIQSPGQDLEFLQEAPNTVLLGSEMWDEQEYTSLADELQAVEDKDTNDFLLCNERIDSFAPSGGLGPNSGFSRNLYCNPNHILQGDSNANGGIADLDNIELDTPPELGDLPIPSSQDSIFDWLDKL